MPRILIAGDRTVDWYFYPRPAEDAGENWRLKPSMRAFCLSGGVLLLKELVAAALAMHKRAAEFSVTPAPTDKLENISPQTLVHSNARLDQLEIGKTKRWMVGKALGFLGPDAGTSTEANAAPQPPMPNPDLIVLDDHGNGFRNERSAWPEALEAWDGGVPIIHKMRHPLDKDRRRDALWHHLQQRLTRESNYLLVISADDLRDTEGVQISQGLSWERTAKDFLFQMQHAPALQPLRHCPCVVVTVGWDGAIVYQPPRSREQATLHFDPQKIEGGFTAALPGGAFGTTSAFLATLVARLILAEQERAKLPGAAHQSFREVIDGAIPECLARARRWLETGFGDKDEPANGYPIATVFPKPPDDPKDALKPPPDVFSWTWIPPTTSASAADPAGWRIIHQEWPSIGAVVAKEYVRSGSSPGLMRSPMGVFGNLKTVDRAEIESYNAIRTLVTEFLDSDHRKRPLCIGVFGPPGAGKSFGVEEVIGSIGGKRVAKMTFNVSQFASERDLVAACHRIRDKVLEGQTPFVFFDEFDSAGLDGAALGWLRTFLALMQDGKFRDGEEMHPLGKCILVFAGGTAANFDEFEQQALTAPAERKGRDFVSRLRGFINVMGPNRQGDDPAYVLRRALVLRSLLERNKDAQGLFNSRRQLQIDEGILRALLLVSNYEHGTRSMEALLEMSQLARQSRFDQYALPPREQLAIHVPADEFMALAHPTAEESAEIEHLQRWLALIGYRVRRIPAGRAGDWGGPGDRPQTPLIPDGPEFQTLAEQAHQLWWDSERARGVKFAVEQVPGKTSPYLRPLDELPQAIRELIDNRVRQMPVILHDAGLEIVHSREPEDWSEPEVPVSKLAEIVHGSYKKTVDAEVDARRTAGFLPQFNPNAQPFDKLPPAKQESNRDFVRTIPRKLFRVGLALKPRDPTAKEPSADSVQLLAERREALAIIEHTRWNWQSVLQGYVYKPGAKNDARRTNPSIVPWEKLPESIREYDRMQPEFLAGLVFEAGFEVIEP
jgi:hypothetical protein